ncbi:U5 small nuclear ribonucleoprotein 40 kDa protein [Lingula anatina]|uniref:U5 small nuclear ribonucleoprotein 40 kDa protein n=1 Tax=Lingula anatina TaxID=7574 RepID=A0A1S3JSX2_LINAN|nr:U5 small nuclear ribonucleoprotein 40 kDa protein [Lingula anatina]|eukprot:XP_013413134.2 U5 small nuclear ribonucleoprotein 40 kDa protein [Lingula anatina]
MEAGKRKAQDMAVVAMKRPRNELVYMENKENGAVVQSSGPPRTSNLLAPIMLLSGHEGEIFTSKFSPDGTMLASAGFDRLIYFWNVYGECENFAVLKGHSGAVMELNFSTDGSQLVTCATDKTIALWDIEVGGRIKRLKGHTSFVNSCNLARRGPQLICSGSDDGSIKLWDSRKKHAIQTFQNTYQVTSLTFNDTAEQVISGGIDNELKVWDLRKNDILYKMRGHTDTVTGMELSPEGSYLLTTAMDNTVRVWDVRPFAPQERCVKIFTGNQHTFEKNLLRCSWSPDGSKVSAGSGDRFVYVWDTTTRRILYKLPGHAGSVNEVDFHPTEPIVLSCSSDKNIYLGEIE